MRFSVLQVPPLRADRRERRLLDESAEAERESSHNREATEMPWARLPPRGQADPECGRYPSRTSINVEVEAAFKYRLYEGMRSLDTKRFRVVGVLVADADDYNLYITNLLERSSCQRI